jgi:hypothetical protein
MCLGGSHLALFVGRLSSGSKATLAIQNQLSSQDTFSPTTNIEAPKLFG